MQLVLTAAPTPIMAAETMATATLITDQCSEYTQTTTLMSSGNIEVHLCPSAVAAAWAWGSGGTGQGGDAGSSLSPVDSSWVTNTPLTQLSSKRTDTPLLLQPEIEEVYSFSTKGKRVRGGAATTHR